MLSAYFDDSGTHDQSQIVLLAGVFGTEAEMTSLEWLWRQELALLWQNYSRGGSAPIHLRQRGHR
jgi:hypothetical protein